MAEDIQLKTYSVSDLREWLLNNRPTAGLSPLIIAPGRAYAIINNPFVAADEPVVCALFVNKELAAYTAAFPEILQKPYNRRVWWFTTLGCNPKYAGRGYGLVVVGTLCEIYGIENCFDAKSAPETVSIFEMLGHKTAYLPLYSFSEKRIRTNSLRGKIAWCWNQMHVVRRRFNSKRFASFSSKREFSIQYLKFIDSESYDFILSQSSGDSLVRSKEAMNWILQYPFKQSGPMVRRVVENDSFRSCCKDYQSFFIKVLVDNRLVAVSMFTKVDTVLSVKYLFYLDDFASVAYHAVVEHIAEYKIDSFETMDKGLSGFLKEIRLFSKEQKTMISFSYPSGFGVDSDIVFQAGIGDMFV